MTATDSPAEAAFRDYAASGDVTGLLALADYLDERGERKTFAKLLRRVAKAADPDVWFFWVHGSVQASTKGEIHAHELNIGHAVQLAKAEDWFEANDYKKHDPDGNWSLHKWRDYVSGRCVFRLSEWAVDNGEGEEHWHERARVENIDLGPDELDSPESRVARAELCLEAMRAIRRKR